MIKKFALMVSVVLMAATANVAEAATQKMQRDETCQYERRASNLFDWLKSSKERRYNKSNCVSRGGTAQTAKSGKPGKPGQPGGANAPAESTEGAPTQTSTATTSDSGSGKGNNGKGTPNGSKTDGGDPPGGGNTGNDGEG